MAHRDDGKGLPALWQEAVRDGEDPLRGLVQHMLQGLLEQEMTAFLKAEPHQRTEQRCGYRNGHRPRTLTTLYAFSTWPEFLDEIVTEPAAEHDARHLAAAIIVDAGHWGRRNARLATVTGNSSGPPAGGRFRADVGRLG